MAARIEEAQPFHVSSRRDAMKIARHFSAGDLGEQKTIVPEGRLNFMRFCISVVPPGLDITPIRNPGTEVPGYYHCIPPGCSFDTGLALYGGFLMPPSAGGAFTSGVASEKRLMRMKTKVSWACFTHQRDLRFSRCSVSGGKDNELYSKLDGYWR